MNELLPLIMLAAAESGTSADEAGDGLDPLVLYGSIGLFLAIVAAITLLRRWR